MCFRELFYDEKWLTFTLCAYIYYSLTCKRFLQEQTNKIKIQLIFSCCAYMWCAKRRNCTYDEVSNQNLLFIYHVEMVEWFCLIGNLEIVHKIDPTTHYFAWANRNHTAELSRAVFLLCVSLSVSRLLGDFSELRKFKPKTNKIVLCVCKLQRRNESINQTNDQKNNCWQTYCWEITESQ